MNFELLLKLTEAQIHFKASKYSETVNEAEKAFNHGDAIECERLLNKLPTVDQLMMDLVKKLEGKRIHETIKKIVSRDLKDSDLIVAKGLSSLLTHCIIECETNLGFRMLIPVIQERLNEALHNSILRG
jgi:hypothetical protein